METIIGIAIYTLGVVLAYGRFTAADYEKNEKLKAGYPNRTFAVKFDAIRGFLYLMSWFGFLCGVIDYFQKKQKYFFKWSISGLNK